MLGYQLVSYLAALLVNQLDTSARRCTALKSINLENTTILDATHVAAGSNLSASTPRACQPNTVTVPTASICRVQAVVNTTDTSSVHFEAWLPDQWFGRFLAVGNGGLAGCIDYTNIDYGSTMHFASVGSDNGHDGSFSDGTAFLNHPEVINDFAFRAIHVEALLGKQLVKAYYQRPQDKSYYLGCSTGGRQGIQSALRFPEDFDGILAGAPATDFNHLLGWQVMLGRFIGAPNTTNSESFIPAELWSTISAEILEQCDELDGVRDGIITNPDECEFRPEELLCTAEVTHTKNCLTPPQVAALNKVYEPLFGTAGQLLYPRYDPGAEADGNFDAILGGEIFPIATGWYESVIFNDTDYMFDNFSIKDVEFADTINPGGIATWDGNLSTFRERGGKVLTYHGRRDPLIASGNSVRMYNLISSTLSLPSLDDFYRLFLIPGMNHCADGPGAFAFGQLGNALNLVNNTAHNALLALVEWVEGGNAPAEIVGRVAGKGKETDRKHCRYPHRSVFDGRNFVCQ